MIETFVMRFSKKTKNTVVFAANEVGAPIQTVYVNTGWLRSQGDSTKEITLTISDEAVNKDAPDENEKDASVDAFDAFLAVSVVDSADGRLTTERIWEAWAAHSGGDPATDIIGVVRKSDVPRRFRLHFSAPAAVRGRVDGRVQRYWKGYVTKTVA